MKCLWLIYECKFLQLNKYASKFVPIETKSCKHYLCGLHDELKDQIVSDRILKFVDLVERVKMVKQALGLDKKTKTT